MKYYNRLQLKVVREIFVFCFISLFFIGLLSCTNNEVHSIERKNLWTMGIGRLEDELDLFDIQGSRSTNKTDVTMRDGLFYISNGNGQKIVRYNSYGDLLFMIYNEENNPPPITLHNRTETESVTRWAYPWPLEDPGSIAVNTRKNIFVENHVPIERRTYDADQMLLDSLVLHFNEDGHFIDYLGQDGLGGTPFPRIDNIYTS
ncbi:MAG: hypothetical protein LBV52_04245, partial [Spirochaetaceae bacterium]|nr:hypothetical protein [Spirochaetaceae bacterium]